MRKIVNREGRTRKGMVIVRVSAILVRGKGKERGRGKKSED